MAESEEINIVPPQHKRMRKTSCGLYCAVGECSSKQADGFSLHKFPSDQNIRDKWIKFVTTCREDFGPRYGTPSKYSAICHLHFDNDCYPASFWLKQGFGIDTYRILNNGSIPTIQKPHRTGSTVTVSDTTSTTDSVTVTVGLPSSSTWPWGLAVSTQTMTRTTNATAMSTTTVTSMNLTPVCTTFQSVSTLKGVSKVRGAYQKRERQSK